MKKRPAKRPSPPANPDIRHLDAAELLRLYTTKQWDALSERFLQHWHFLESNTWVSVNHQEQYAIDVFVKHFLYLFTQPDYRIGEAHLLPFIRLNPVISNVVATSSTRTTDPWIDILLAQPHNVIKLLTLYSARNRVRLKPEVLFNADPRLSSYWYLYFIMGYSSALVEENAHAHLREHVARVDPRLIHLEYWHEVSFGVTYVDPDRDRNVKQQINEVLSQRFTASGVCVGNRPNPRRIGVLTFCWQPLHSVYRNQYRYLESLAQDYELVLFELGDRRDDTDKSLFKDVHHLQMRGTDLAIDPLLGNDFRMLYYPDVGMSMESIFLSNMRLAPIQVTSYGHSVSTFGSKIDYWIGGAAAEHPDLLKENYSERLVLLPGLGITNVKPPYQVQQRKPPDDRVVLNCSWYAQKMNHPLMQVCRRIVDAAPEVLFRIFGGGGVARRFHFIPFVREVEQLLGVRHVEVMQSMPYNEYMAIMEEGHFCLEPFHFGGCNTVVDSLHLGQPIVTLEGTHWYNRIGSAILRLVGLDELVARDVDEYVEITLRLIRDVTYRQSLCDRIRDMDLDATVYGALDVPHFKAAIDYLMQNHERLAAEGSREPIELPGCSTTGGRI
ncbi:MAG: O-linked N-acetylglucosamine transferase family protein [Candidatus Xenobia bacterium]